MCCTREFKLYLGNHEGFKQRRDLVRSTFWHSPPEDRLADRRDQQQTSQEAGEYGENTEGIK